MKQKASKSKSAGKSRASVRAGGRPARRASLASGVSATSIMSPAAPSVGSALPACPVERECGACQNVGVPYGEQLARKHARVAELFADLVPSANAVLPVLGMDDPYHYRNKVVSPYAPGRKPQASGAGRGRGGKVGRAGAPRDILTGMYAAHSHRLVPTDTCLLENQVAKGITLAIRGIMLKYGIEPYDEDAGTGFLRHAVVRVGHASGEVLVTLVTNAREFPSSRSFCRELARRCPAVTTVVQNVNMRQTNVILGDEEHVLYGPGFILDTLCGLSFRISSRSFYQVNAVQTEVLYRTAMAAAQLAGTETVIDAYCGTGTIGLVAAKCGAARVVGVDSVAAAIRDARQNARHNGVENAEFVVGDAGEFMRSLAAGQARLPGSPDARVAKPACPQASGPAESGCPQAGDGSPVPGGASAEGIAQGECVLFMDPPRAGADEAFLEAAATLAPARIVYISCNPETQARDVALLRKRGYELRTVQPVDMFPHTDHVETVVQLVLGPALTSHAPPPGATGRR